MLNSADQPARAGLARRAGLLVAIPTALLALLAGCGDEGGQTPKAEGGAPTETALAQTDVASETSEPESTEPKTTEVAADAAPTKDAAAVAALEEKGYALGDVVLGDPNAPVTLIEYASLTCPHCAEFQRDTLPTLKKNYIDTGKVKLIVRELHGHRIGLYAAALARCGGPEKYYAFLDVLFSRQDAFLTQDNDANLAELRRVGKLGGLSNERMEACFNDEDYLRELLRFSQEHLKKDDVPATPYLIAQPGPDQETIRGAVGPDELGATLDKFLNK